MSIQGDATEEEAPDSRRDKGKNGDDEEEWQEHNYFGDHEDEGIMRKNI